MSKRMIIDASHREETRVVVLDGQKVEEFDFEAASKRPLKGNIYLAKVTRVEPSLQAAFVEYGGNRQGFLAFAEIHPDYYQIPIADRMALIAEQEAEARRSADDDVESVEITSVPAQESAAEAAGSWLDPNDGQAADETSDEDAFGAAHHDADTPEAEHSDAFASLDSDLHAGDAAPITDLVDAAHENGAEPVEPRAEGGNQVAKLQAPRPSQRWTRRRHYKIQEVIKRRQVILVQVVKEERGNKGAALTTYLSLAGRYCVLMPNTPRGGGISRKITSAADRTRLKSAAQSLELPEGMGLIIRTAGENRTKAEIKRDYEYLLRMWDTIRELTLKSNAPACVYEEGDLIKRAIRDLYNKDVSEIVVEGEDGYRNAKDFMRMLMPSHAKNVKPYKEPIPLFQRYQIEAQLDAMFSPTVTLRSGGYIVINQTEALVSIDVNSGRATREHSIEDTAYKTNLEAAEEISRQLRLRDLAGLIVIDFIDMEDPRNDRNVEKRLRDCIKNDRARVQIGKISQFGLLEMSRQRLRAGVVAGSTVPCPHCGGQGIVRSVESTALRLLRGLEEEAQRQRAAMLNVRAPIDVAIYALNQKRRELAHIESEYALAIQFEAKNDMLAGTFEIDRIGQRAPEDRVKPVAIERAAPPPAPVEPVAEAEEVQEPAEPQPSAEAQPTTSSGSKRRRRRRRGRDRYRAPLSQEMPENGVSERLVAAEQNVIETQVAAPAGEEPPGAETAPSGEASTSSGSRKRRRRRRGRRGSRENGSMPAQESGHAASASHDDATIAESAVVETRVVETEAVPELNLPTIMPNTPSEPVWSLSPSEPQHATLRHEQQSVTHPEDTHQEMLREPIVTARTQADVEPPTLTMSAPPPAEPKEPPPPPKKGWWQRPFRSRE